MDLDLGLPVSNQLSLCAVCRLSPTAPVNLELHRASVPPISFLSMTRIFPLPISPASTVDWMILAFPRSLLPPSESPSPSHAHGLPSRVHIRPFSHGIQAALAYSARLTCTRTPCRPPSRTAADSPHLDRVSRRAATTDNSFKFRPHLHLSMGIPAQSHARPYHSSMSIRLPLGLNGPVLTWAKYVTVHEHCPLLLRHVGSRISNAGARRTSFPGDEPS